MNIFGNKKLLIVFVGSIVVCILLLVVILSIPKKPSGSMPTPPTPTEVVIKTSDNNSNATIPITAVPTTFLKDNTHNFTLQYPQTFSEVTNSNPNDTSLTLIFTQDNKIYHFLVSPPGQVNPEVDATTRVQQDEATYGGKQFTRRMWLKNGKPIYIVAIPKDLTAIPYLFSMELPTANLDMYIATFEKMVSSFSR